MPLSPGWFDIALRLLCALIAGAFIGLNRTEQGHTAGLRTSMLVCLAACIAMIQVNLLLPLSGRSGNSFVMNDLMRLPLGILSGMGFIGAGAVFRRGNLIAGITTAATLWFLTVIGLCFGGGQIVLGLVGAALALVILIGLKYLEDRMKQAREASLNLRVGPAGPRESEVHNMLEASGFTVDSCAFGANASGNRELIWQVHWRALPEDNQIPGAIQRLAEIEGVHRVRWTPRSR